jgi:hypothetical protein
VIPALDVAHLMSGAPPQVHLVPSEPEATRQALGATLGWRTLYFDRATLADFDALRDAMATQLHLTSPWGRNWNAIADVLTDRTLLRFAGLLVVADCTAMSSDTAVDAAVLIDVMVVSASWWRERHVPVHLVIECDAAEGRLLVEKGSPGAAFDIHSAGFTPTADANEAPPRERGA